MPISTPCFIESPETGIVKKLDYSAFNFYRTGSRLFNTATNKSDYDFFTNFNCNTLLFLEGLGFNSVSSFGFNSAPEYNDPSVHSVLRIVNFHKQIDVQLIYPEWMDIKILAHRVILKNYWFKQNKDDLRNTWTTVLRTLWFLKKGKHLNG